MIVKRLAGAHGFGVIYDEITRSLIVALMPGLCFRFHWPRTAACAHCGHGPSVHRASRDHGFIKWQCLVVDGQKQACDCDKYAPERS